MSLSEYQLEQLVALWNCTAVGKRYDILRADLLIEDGLAQELAELNALEVIETLSYEKQEKLLGVLLKANEGKK